MARCGVTCCVDCRLVDTWGYVRLSVAPEQANYCGGMNGYTAPRMV